MEIIGIILLIFVVFIGLAMIGAFAKVFEVIFGIIFAIFGFLINLACDGIGCLIVIGIIVFILATIL